MNKNKMKTKMFVLSTLALIMTIVSLGVIQLFHLVETKTAEAKTRAVNYITGELPDYAVNVPRKGSVAREMTVKEKIVYYSEIFGVNPEDALRIATCESNLDPKAENVNGSATGVYQWIRKSWKNYCNGDVYNADANIICFMRLYPKHPNFWECK
jgi:soluble lytic murein transglycosylase-like protein